MMRKSLVLTLAAISLFTAGMALMPQSAHAATEKRCESKQSSIPIIPTWYKYLDTWYDEESKSCIVDDDKYDSNSFNFFKAIPAILLAVFEIILRMAGILAVIFIVYGGFQYLITTGEPEKAKNARTTIINALVGLMIAILSVAIVNVVGRNIG